MSLSGNINRPILPRVFAPTLLQVVELTDEHLDFNTSIGDDGDDGFADPNGLLQNIQYSAAVGWTVTLTGDNTIRDGHQDGYKVQTDILNVLPDYQVGDNIDMMMTWTTAPTNDTILSVAGPFQGFFDGSSLWASCGPGVRGESGGQRVSTFGAFGDNGFSSIGTFDRMFGGVQSRRLNGSQFQFFGCTAVAARDSDDPDYYDAVEAWRPVQNEPLQDRPGAMKVGWFVGTDATGTETDTWVFRMYARLVPVPPFSSWVV